MKGIPYAHSTCSIFNKLCFCISLQYPHLLNNMLRDKLVLSIKRAETNYARTVTRCGTVRDLYTGKTFFEKFEKSGQNLMAAESEMAVTVMF